MADDRISYAPTDGSQLRPRRAEVLGPRRSEAGDHPGLRGLSRLPHVLQVLRRLPQPVRVHRQATRRQGAGADRGRDRAGDGRLLPVQAVRGAVSRTRRGTATPSSWTSPSWSTASRRCGPESKGVSLRDKFLGDPDAAGKAARLSGGLANTMNRVKAHRWFMEKTLGIHRDKLLPPFASRTFEEWAVEQDLVKAVPGGEAVLFQTCYVQNNEPADRPGHRRGAAEEPGGRALRARPGLLRDARLGERQLARVAEARPAQPGRADAVRGQGRQGAGHQPHLLDDVAAGIPDAGGGGGSPARP